MLTLRQQSVKVDRLELIVALKKGRELHRDQFADANYDYQQAVKKFLALAVAQTDHGNFDNVHLTLKAPVSREAEYNNVIEMMMVSVDDNIQLDMESYKAYYKNEWPWSRDFELAAGQYKSALTTFIGGAL